MSEPIKIDVWSDIGCPWCFIGKRKLEGGVAAFQTDAEAPEVVVEYHSYELNPETPVDFEGSAGDYFAQKMGTTVEALQGMQQQVVGAAASVGLEMNYDTVQHTNTVKAHQLLHYAKARGVQLQAVDRLLSAYFTEGRHVGRVEELAELGAELGLDPADIIRSLNEDEYLGAVRADQAQARQFGITGVPFFVIDGKYGVSGAQDPDTFAQVLQQVRSERAEEISA